MMIEFRYIKTGQVQPQERTFSDVCGVGSGVLASSRRRSGNNNLKSRHVHDPGRDH